MDDDIEKERRKAVQLLKHWNVLRADRDMPEEEEIDPDIISHLWDYCFIVQLRDLIEVEHYNYTYLGPKIIEAYDKGFINENVPGLVGLEAEKQQDSYNTVISTRQPLHMSGEYRFGHGELIRYRQSMFPLGNEEEGVVSILGIMSYKIY